MRPTQLNLKLSVFLIFILGISSCCSYKLCYTGVPDKVISPERADILEEEWKRTRAVAINSSDLIPGFVEEDGREFYFTIAELKQYLAYVEHESEKLGYKNEDLGIRIYLGAYPADDNASLQPGLATVFLAPTVKGPSRSEDNINMDDVGRFNMTHTGQPPKEH